MSETSSAALTPQSARASRRTRGLLIAAVVGIIAVPVFAALHNVFAALAVAAGPSGWVSDLMVGLSAASFVLALAVAPALAVICLVGAALDRLTRGLKPAPRRAVLVTVPAATALAAVLLLGNWLSPSVIARDSSAGFNGSFEVVRGGLPVNWRVYKEALDEGDAALDFDASERVEGSQSLMLRVRRVDENDGWHNAGLFQGVDAEAGRAYRVTFWLKTEGSRVRVRLDSEQGDERLPRRPIERVIEGADDWQRVEATYTVPQGFRDIRFELNVLAPGTVWVDDVRIEPLS